MPRCPSISFILILTLSALLGCSSGTDYVSAVYDTCYAVDDCVETATLCEELHIDFSGFAYVNAICTLTCETEGPVSPDCPRAWVGRFGSCYPSSVGGGIDDTLICFDPCDSDGDCLLDFRCLNGVDLCGTDASGCPIGENDMICVPGPS